jgi:hypothetical protein
MRALVAALIATLACAPSLLHAQDDATARQEAAAARALFEEGVAFFDRGELESAEDRFRRSLAIRRTDSVMFNLAAVLVRRGHLVESQELFRRVAASEGASERLRGEARARAEEVGPRIARLTVEVSGDATSARIRVDELELSAAMIGVPIPVDPGARRVVAEVGGRAVHDRTIELGEGGREEIRVVLEVASAEDAARTVALPEEGPAAPAPAGDVTGEWWLWTLVAVGVAALIAGGVAIGLAVDDSRYFSGNLGRIVLP